jgi:hypothetical protein
MTCIKIPNGYVCLGNGGFYLYKGQRFEFDERWGPQLVNAQGSGLSKEPSKKFWNIFEEWQTLSNKEKAEYELDWKRNRLNNWKLVLKR